MPRNPRSWIKGTAGKWLDRIIHVFGDKNEVPGQAITRMNRNQEASTLTS